MTNIIIKIMPMTIVSMELKFSYLHGYGLVYFEHKAGWCLGYGWNY